MPAAPLTTLITPQLLFLLVIDIAAVTITSGIGDSTNCCKLRSSDDFKLVERLSLDANEVDNGEFLSTDEATSNKGQYYVNDIKLII